MATFLEDVTPGSVWRLGEIGVEREEILSFARRFDPQPFHVDDGAAAASPFGGLVASGWHTAALTMRLIVGYLLELRVASLGSPGVDELRWLRPVRPGDTLSATAEVLEARPSRSRPDRGSVRLRVVTRNQDGDEVMSMISLGLVSRRPG